MAKKKTARKSPPSPKPKTRSKTRSASRKPGKSRTPGKSPAPKAASRPAHGPDPKVSAIESMTFAHGLVQNVCDFPHQSLTHQNHAHENHVLWTLGHLACTYDWFAGMLDGEPSRIPAHFQQPFGYKSKPIADHAAYPPIDEVRSVFDASWNRLASAALRTSAADLAKPTLADSMGFAKDRLTALHRVAWHDGWHAGQVSTIRRSLGLKSVM